MKARKRTRTTKTGFLYLVLVAMALGIVGCGPEVTIKPFHSDLTGEITADMFEEKLNGDLDDLKNKRINIKDSKVKEQLKEHRGNNEIVKDGGVMVTLTYSDNDNDKTYRTTKFKQLVLPKDKSKVTFDIEPGKLDYKLKFIAQDEEVDSGLDSNFFAEVTLTVDTKDWEETEEEEWKLVKEDWDGIDEVDEVGDFVDKDDKILIKLKTPCTLTCTELESKGILKKVAVKNLTKELMIPVDGDDENISKIGDEIAFEKSGDEAKYTKIFQFEEATTTFVLKTRPETTDSIYQYGWIQLTKGYDYEDGGKLEIKPTKFQEMIEDQIKYDKAKKEGENHFRVPGMNDDELMMVFHAITADGEKSEAVKKKVSMGDTGVSITITINGIDNFKPTISPHTESRLFALRGEEHILLGNFSADGAFSSHKTNKPKDGDVLSVHTLRPEDSAVKYTEQEFDKDKTEYNFVEEKETE